MTYLLDKPPNMEFRFVIGLPMTKFEATLLALEAKAYGDILILDIDENMDNGKSLSYFKRLSADYPASFRFAMKADDDCYFNLPNIAKELSTLPRYATYWGRKIYVDGIDFNFNAGMVLVFFYGGVCSLMGLG